MILLVGVVASAVQAGILAPVAAPAAVLDTNYDPLPQYTYAYNIQDSLTGDSKSQQETRNGEVVKGSFLIHSHKSFEQVKSSTRHYRCLTLTGCLASSFGWLWTAEAVQT